MSENKKKLGKRTAIWVRPKLADKITKLIEWMEKITLGRSISGADSLRLLFKVWDKLSEKKKLKLMEGE